MPPLEMPAPGSRFSPLKSQGAADAPGAAVSAAVVGPVLHADQCRFRPAEVAPLGDARHHVVVNRDLPKEVVGCEEREVSPEVAVLRDHVVLMRSDVLVMSREDER